MCKDDLKHIEKALDRIEHSVSENRKECRENFDKCNTTLSELEVAYGKTQTQMKTVQDELMGLKKKVRRIELIFAPVTFALGAFMAWVLKKFGV